MKQLSLHILAFLVIAGFSSCQEKTPEKILKKTLSKIEKINTIEQVLATDYYDSSNYYIKHDTSVYYFEFSDEKSVVGAKYLCPGNYLSSERPAEDFVYELAKIKDRGYGRKVYEGGEFYYFPVFGSIDAVKRFLPTILADSTVQITRLNDTTLNNFEDHFHVNILLQNKAIEPGGKIALVSYAEDYLRFSYDLFIAKESFLPSEIIFHYTYLDKNHIWWRARTLRYDFDPQKPDKTWNLTSNPLNFIVYTEEEIMEDKMERLHVQIINTRAPGWELEDLSGNMHSLGDFRDKLLLIEFWFIGCGPCRRSIPFLNELKKKYDPGKFDVVGINTIYKENDKLKKYASETGMEFLVLNNGGQTAINYKMHGAPLMLLIKNGIIIHAIEGYNEEKKAELIKIIEKNI